MKRLLLLTIFGIGMGLMGWGQISISSLPYNPSTTNFNSYNPSSSTNLINTIPAGWTASSSGTATYNGQGTGTGTSGGYWGYGTSSEFSLGALRSGTPGNITYTVNFTNNSGNTITSISLSWDYEQWRYANTSGWNCSGTGQLSGNTTLDGKDFSGSATGTNGTPTTTAVSSFTLSGLSIANGQTFGISWLTTDPTGSDNGVSIDNFLISASGPTISNSSDIITASNETNNIMYASYQASSISSTSDAIRLFSFTIRDGGGSTDPDALPTILASITLNKGAGNGVTSWASTLRQAALYDGSTEVAEVSVTGETIAFTGLSGANVTADDGGTKTLDLYVTFESTVTDNQQFQFQITNANVTAAASGSSTFTAFTAVLSSVTGDANRIEVTASDIIFDQNVSTVSLGAVMSPSPTLRAIDANVNYDLDYGISWSVTVTAGSTTFDPGATTSGNFASGTATLSNLKFNTAATGNKITVSSGSLTDAPFTDESSSFDVTDPQPEINIKVVSTNYLTGSTYAFGDQVSGTSSSAITFTIENLGTANLNLTDTPKVSKSGTNASEFTIDETLTATPVGASSNTTFTITFSPTTQGAKSAAISIGNNDSDENPYTINLTGTGMVSSASDIINTGGYSYTSNIAYASYQSASGLTTGNSAGVNGLTIRDGGATTDADNLGTTLTAISFSTSGSTAIRTAALFDGASNVSEVAVNGATTIAFSDLTLSAADGFTKDFELRVTFQSSVTDNQQITFTVSSGTASSSGSGFASGNAGGAASSISGDINRLEVTASLLAFVVQPSNVVVSSNISPAVTVTANDANGIRDLDYVTDISITATGATLTGSPVTGTPASGLATFSTLSFSTEGTGVTLGANSGALTSATSNAFNVIALPITAWNPSGISSYGPSPWTATTVNSHLSVGGLTRGSGVGTSGTAASDAWGGSMNTANVSTSAAAISANQFVTFTITPNTNYATSLSTFDLFYRRSNSGPASGLLQYAIGSGSYNDISTLSFSTGSSGAAITQIDLSAISALQVAVEIIKFRIVLYANTTVNGTWYVFNTGLAIGGTVFQHYGEPSNHATAFTASTHSSNSVTLTWTDAIGAQLPENYLIKAIEGTSPPTTPVDGVAESDAALVHNVAYGVQIYTFTGLSTNTTYTFKIWSSTNSGGLINYKTDGIVPSVTTNTGGYFRSVLSGNWGDAATTWEYSSNGSTGWAAASSQPLFSDNVVIQTGHTITIDGTLKTCQDLSIEASAKLVISPAQSLTVTGTLTNSATASGLVIESNSSGTGSLKHVTASVPATVKRYFTGAAESWHLLSSPVASQAITGDFIPSGTYGDGTGYDFYTWYEPASTWVNFKNTTVAPTWNTANGSTNFVVGRGYMVAYQAANPTKTFTGNLSQGTINIPLSYSGTGTYQYSNLVGNPYPSSIDWKAATGWTRNFVVTNAGGYDMQIWNQSSANYGAYNSAAVSNDGTNGATRYIAPMQGFMVKASGAGNLTMTDDVRVHSSQAFLKSTEELTDYLKLTVTGSENTYSDQAIIEFNHDSDQGGASKMFSFVAEAPGLYTSKEGSYYSIDFRGVPEGATVIPLNFKAGVDGNYFITASDLETFDAGVVINLEDVKTGQIQNLMDNPVYSFVASKDDETSRFKLHFGGTFAVNDIQGMYNIRIYTFENSVYFTTLTPQDAYISVFNITGQEVYSTRTRLDGMKQIGLNVPTGWYVVKVMCDEGIKSEKIFIR